MPDRRENKLIHKEDLEAYLLQNPFNGPRVMRAIGLAKILEKGDLNELIDQKRVYSEGIKTCCLEEFNQLVKTL